MKFIWLRKAAAKVRNLTLDRLYRVPRKLERIRRKSLIFIRFHASRMWLLGVYVVNFKKAPDRAFREDFRTIIPQSKSAGTPRFCVYITVFGDVDELHSPVINLENVDFICFTDQDFEVYGWQMRKVASQGNPIWQAKEYKLLPHVHLSEYEASLFIDANLTLLEDVSSFVRRWLAHENFAMRKHPHRQDCVNEAAKIIALRKAQSNFIIEQIQRYAKLGLPRNSGMIEANFIWRKHNCEAVRSLMSLWHSEIIATSMRDQLSLCYLMWSTGYRPAILPPTNGKHSFDKFFARQDHRPRFKPIDSGVSGKKLSVKFLYGSSHQTIGSTVLRTSQLANILSLRLGEKYDIETSCDFTAKDSIIVLSKNVLQSISNGVLSNIRKNNIAVVADWVDSSIRVELLQNIDVMLACSINAFAEMTKRFPLHKVAIISHHVDFRIPSGSASDSFSIGYFGNKKQSYRTDAIEDLVDFCWVNTKTSQANWVDQLSRHSMHYAIRPVNGDKGIFKPFTKGFIAAHCGANILVSRDESDALHILGDDYPYLLKSRNEKEILEMIAFARESFGGPEWKRGREMMDRSLQFCHPDYIARQFEAMVQGLVR